MEENKTYTVTLEDGTVLENLTSNGSYYVSPEELDVSMFENNCSTVTVNDGTGEATFTNVELINIIKLQEGWGFAFRVLTEAELASLQIQSDIDYIAMMTGIEL